MVPRPSEVFERSEELGWGTVFLVLTASSFLFFITLLLRGWNIANSLIAFFSYFLFLIIISLHYSPLYYLFLRDYISLRSCFKGILLLTFPLFLLGSGNPVLTALSLLSFHISVFANIRKVIRDDLESLIVTFFPSTILVLFYFQILTF